jgi:hypothetical protein
MLDKINQWFQKVWNVAQKVANRGMDKLSKELADEQDAASNLHNYWTTDKSRVETKQREGVIKNAIKMYVDKKQKTDPSYNFSKFSNEFMVTPDLHIVKRPAKNKK